MHVKKGLAFRKCEYQRYYTIEFSFTQGKRRKMNGILLVFFYTKCTKIKGFVSSKRETRKRMVKSSKYNSD